MKLIRNNADAISAGIGADTTYNRRSEKDYVEIVNFMVFKLNIDTAFIP